jgi:D-galactose 1-dehydrogenase
VTRTPPITVGIVGFGKIARDQHVPAILADGRFTLHSIADTAAGAAPVRKYANVEALIAADDAPAAVAICTPPQARHAVARHALERGRHVLLEKPPAATVAELMELRALAESSRSTLFCAWHSQFAPAVAPAREWLEGRTLQSVRITWREDVRAWHPGQRWLWESGGFGVFDPGINAFSVAARILPHGFFVREAALAIPENCATPIAAEIEFTDVAGMPITASLDFLQEGPPTWDIEVRTDAGVLLLSRGGERLSIDGREVRLPSSAEYPALYAHFAGLIEAGLSDTDPLPLELALEALRIGRRTTAPPFVDAQPPPYAR